MQQSRPSCALPLAGIAARTPSAPNKRMSFLAFCLAALVAFWVIAYTGDQVTAAHRRKALATFTAEIQAGGRLTTPTAFQDACGKADASAQAHGITRLT
jgi:hypothetical protein